MEIPTSKCHIFVEGRITRIFWLGREEMMEEEIPGDIERDYDEGALGLEDISEVNRHDIFARCHNSIVGHLGAERTLKDPSLGGHGWSDMRRDVTRMVSECSIYQKLKYQRELNWEYAVDHSLDHIILILSLLYLWIRRVR